MSHSLTAAIPSEFGPRLKNYRERAAFTREEIGVRVGCSAYAVRDWEMGKRPPSMVQLGKLAKAYGVLVSELIDAA